LTHRLIIVLVIVGGIVGLLTHSTVSARTSLNQRETEAVHRALPFINPSTFAAVSPETRRLVLRHLSTPLTPVLLTSETKTSTRTTNQSRTIPQLPFYSQFADITSPTWQKVACGIASVAMIIDHYSDEPVVPNTLLQNGIKAGAYIESAGWSHQGLINLAKPYGLDGKSHSLAHLSMTDAFAELSRVVSGEPVMTSVHYTFDPENPIPHLVVVTGVDDAGVHYSDPAESSGNRTLSTEKFKSAWKKRYISIRQAG
jgi:predicted double-glycine peptidase